MNIDKEKEILEKLSEKFADYWNTRIIKHTVKYLDKIETYYGIHEVYYDKEDKPVLWTSEPIDVTFQDKEEFEILLKQILDAKDRTILELDEENTKLIDINIKL